MPPCFCLSPIIVSGPFNHRPFRFPKAGVAGLLVLLILSVSSLSARAMTVTDALNRKIAVPTPVRRIVALNSDAIEVLRTLKAQDRIVAVHDEIVRETEFWGHLAELPRAGGWRTPNLEAIAAFAPDLVLAYGRNPGEELDRKMAALRIPVLRLDFYRLPTLESEVRTLGRLLGRETEAAAFCSWHAGHLSSIRQHMAHHPLQPLVYLESYSDLSTSGPGSGAHEMCIVAGGRNLAADMSVPYPKVSSEWVVARNPDVIVKAASYGNGYALKDAAFFNNLRDAIMNRPVWSTVPAVEAGRVHVMDSAIWTGPRALIGIGWLARWFHPEAFTDLDPETWHKEYLEQFQGIPYQGVFASDPILKDHQ